MFQIEFMNLLLEFKKSNSTNINSIKNKVKELIKNNPKKVEIFLEKNIDFFDENTKQFIDDISNEIDSNLKNNIINDNKKEENLDIEILKEKYEIWLELITKNNWIVNDEIHNLIVEIVNFYLKNREEVLKKLLEIKLDDNFEKFKTMIKNNMRIFYIKKIENYFEDENYKKLGFFKKMKKNTQLLKLSNEIGNYKFDKKKIEEVCEI